MKVGTLALILVAPAIFLEAKGLTVLWAWFVMPTFGAAALAFYAAMGLSLCVSYLRGSYSHSRQTEGLYDEAVDTSNFSTMTTHFFITPLMVLGLGWLIQLGM